MVRISMMFLAISLVMYYGIYMFDGWAKVSGNQLALEGFVNDKIWIFPMISLIISFVLLTIGLYLSFIKNKSRD